MFARGHQPALGDAVRLLREKRGMTQEAVAQAAGITTATHSLIERGLAKPTWDTVKKIAAALGSSMGEPGKLTDDKLDTGCAPTSRRRLPENSYATWTVLWPASSRRLNFSRGRPDGV